MMLLVATDDLLAAAEVARFLGVSRQRVFQLKRQHSDFPEPIAVLSVGQIWRAKDIAAWAERHGRDTDKP